MKGPISVTQAFLPGLRKQAGGGVVVHLGGCDGRPRGAAVHERLRGDPRRAGELRAIAPTASLLRDQGAYFPSSGLCHPTPSRSPHSSTCGARWGVSLDEPDVVAREILATIRQRRRVPRHGGRDAQDADASRTPCRRPLPTRFGLRKFGKLIQQYRPH